MDSQESGKDIVVQVIGEISNKAAAHRKFVQTFVLAEQPKGYFVLNDIFRYIIEDEDEGMENGQTAGEEVVTAEAEPMNSSNDVIEPEYDIEQVDQKLQEEMVQKPFPVDTDSTDVTPANGDTVADAVEVKKAEDAPVAAVEKAEEPTEAPEQAAESVAREDEQVEPEKPRDPDPAPIASPAKPAEIALEVPAPAASVKPAAPKTWAKLVAANRIAAPAVPNGAPPTSTATPPASQTKTAPSTTNQSATPPPAASEENPAKAQQNGNAGWQMAGSDNNKKQGRQHGSSSSVSGAQEVFLGYVKNVTDKVDASILKTTLSQYGKLLYFDVSRPKVHLHNNKPHLAEDANGISRIVLSSSSPIQRLTTRLLQPILTPLVGSKFTWKNADLEPTPTGATMLSEVECVAAVGAMKAAQEANKDGVAFPKTVVAPAMRLVEEEEV